MKIFRIIASFLVLSLVLGLALPAFAAPDKEKEMGRPEGKMEVIKGNIASITGSVVKIGDKDVQVNDQTQIKLPTMAKKATLADLKVGMLVIAQVFDNNGTLTARHIIGVPGKPETKHNVGEVTAFAYVAATGGNITIKDKKGEETAFVILAGQFKVLPEGATVKVGDIVTVISHRDPAQNRLIASGVVIHQPKGEGEHQGDQKISGVITLDTTAKTLSLPTTPPTVIKYEDANTIWVLKGVLAVASGQEATIFYKTVGTDKIATRVFIGIDPGQLGKLGD